MAELTEEANEIVTESARKCYQGERVEYELAKYDIYLEDIGWGREVYNLPAKYVCNSDSHSKYVIKIPLDSMNSEAEGLEQNRQEIKAWEDRLKSYRNHLVPIIDYHPKGWWIVMPHAESIDKDSPEGQKRIKELKSEGFEFKDEVDLGHCNGEIMLLDYGYGVEIVD